MNIRNKLDFFKGKFNPMNAMMGAFKSLLPQLGATIESMEQPEAAGGLLKEDEQKIAFVIIQRKGETALTICPLKATPEGMLITRTISDEPLENILSSHE